MRTKTFHGFIFSGFERFWDNLRLFFYRHKTLFDILFLLIYTSEQLLLFNLINNAEKAHTIAGIFAIIIISTIFFEKICMESRYNYLKDNGIIQELHIDKVERGYNLLLNENEQLKKILEQNLKK